MPRLVRFGLLLISIASMRAQYDSSTHISEYEHRVAHEPENGTAHFSYGQFLADLDDASYYDKAFFHLQRATELEPHNLQWHFTLGSFCCRIGRLKDSIAAYQKILLTNPRSIPVLYNAAFTFKISGSLDLAQKIYTHILKHQPNYEPAHLGSAFTYLAQGAFHQGWEAHQWNLTKQGKNAPELRKLITENNLIDKRILLVPEGGIGDTLNFIRYAQRLKQKGAYIIAAVQEPLLPLLSRCHYIDELMPTKGINPSYDARATLMSLPALFDDDEMTLPQNIPYIFPDPEHITYWKNKLDADTSFKIGICWQPDLHNDESRLPIARRGIPLSFFQMLGSTSGITLYSLQKKEGLNQIAHLPTNVSLTTFNDTFDEAHGAFMDSAALMQSLDLIISTDTAIAHLAGALGKPVWLLLPYNTDWRWLAQRKGTPWYPTMRIFKQDNPFDWQSTMDALHAAFFNEVIDNKK